MYQFIETIYFKDNEMPLRHWHEQRFAKTQIAHFGKLQYLSLSELIALKQPDDVLKNQVYKIRVVYSESNASITFQPYHKKEINHLHLVWNDTIDYSFKYLDRTALEQMKVPFENDAEIIIVKNGWLTDTTFTNIALFNGNEWHTPGTPLLEGTQRAFLLQQQTIIPALIHVNNLHHYTKIRLFNAMVCWEEAWELPIAALQF
ncbi:MAG: hypothetical protein QM610_03785 [Chitinophagaceae bacterium]